MSVGIVFLYATAIAVVVHVRVCTLLSMDTRVHNIAASDSGGVGAGLGREGGLCNIKHGCVVAPLSLSHCVPQQHTRT